MCQCEILRSGSLVSHVCCWLSMSSLQAKTDLVSAYPPASLRQGWQSTLTVGHPPRQSRSRALLSRALFTGQNLVTLALRFASAAASHTAVCAPNGHPQGRRPGRHRLHQAPSCAQHVRPRRTTCVGSGRRSRAAAVNARWRCPPPPPPPPSSREQSHVRSGKSNIKRGEGSRQPRGTVPGQPGAGREASPFASVAGARWEECAGKQ